jgi:hypothetical protein
LDQGTEMIIFEPILTTSLLEAAGAVAKIGSSLKSNRHKQI